MNLREGTFLQNRYEILARIGSGGMSDVYKALDHKLERLVAIKVLKEEYALNAAFVNRFKMEAQASAGLDDANIVNVYDVVDEGKLHYIVMELVNGITLKKYILKMGHLGIRESIAIASQVANGLAAAHAKGIVHRDIKPQNVIITSDSKVKVADFGLAGANDTDAMNSVAMGSVEYISPEQAQGLPADPRSDIYSLGITLYEMVTGQLPFTGDTTVAIALAHIEKEIPLPSSKNPLVPATLEQIILKCTQKRPERRYQSAYELIQDLRTAMVKSDITIKPDASHDGGTTRMISPEELGKINTSVKINNSAKVNPPAKNNPPAKVKTRDDYEKESDKDKSKDRLIILIAAIITILVVAVILFFMGKSTGLFNGNNEQIETETESTEEISDREVSVPEVRGYTEELALQRLHESSLEMDYDYANSNTVEKGTIIDQNPEPGTVVDKYSKVKVVISLGTDGEEPTVADVPETSVDEAAITKVPVLIGNTEMDAIGLLADSELMPGEVTMVPSDTVEAGLIISQTVLPDTEITKGTPIGYTISLGPETGNYVASIDETCSLDYFDGPGTEGQKIDIMIRLHQVVDGEDVFTVLMPSRSIAAGTLIPVRFPNIEGAFGVDEGLVEVIRVDTEEILQTYPVEFFHVG